MTTKELIADLVYGAFGEDGMKKTGEEVAEAILALPCIVELAEDQTLPKCPYPDCLYGGYPDPSGIANREIYYQAQQDMIADGWRRTVKE